MRCKKILDALIQISDEGNVRAQMLKQILSSNPGLFMLVTQNGSNFFKTLNVLSDFCGFTFENSMRFIAE